MHRQHKLGAATLLPTPHTSRPALASPLFQLPVSSSSFLSILQGSEPQTRFGRQ